ncbi:UNVERIFIED_CONTAM: Receptor-like protein EIX2 [Sesamum radiatum]|uniref:Receptor-like protein EIX2 n=1 Tax=Sesamum radiatum TaxID=300843 RepID=A0AAW2M450_SESRA
MNDHKGIIAIKQLQLLLLLLPLLSSIVCMGSYAFVSGSRPGDVVEVRCIEREREALLEFKQGLIDQVGLLSSWGGEEHQNECCKWCGVECSETTRHVIGLQLSFGTCSALNQELHPLKGNISPALLQLQHLNYLDLSGNHFYGEEIPGFITSFNKLEHLYLDYCGFSGIIPHQLGNMTNLRTLDLSWNSLVGGIPISLANLSSLLYLNLSHNQITGLMPELRGLISLRELHLSHNFLGGVVSEAHFSNLQSLKLLDLSFNSLIFNLTIIDWVPPFQLDVVKLASCNLGPHFPKWLQTQTNLSYLDLSSAGISGQVPIVSEAHFLNLHSLKVLDLSLNSLVFNSTTDWVPPFQLDVLKLTSCNLGPHLPKWLQTQSNLSELDLSWAGISGKVPKWLWDLSPRLQYLNLSHNHFSGSVPDLSSKFSGFPIIDISYNNFSGFLPLFHGDSRVLQLSNNMFRGSTSSICSIHAPGGLLDFSYNQLSGPLPNCLSMEKINVLNLANNQIYGEIPDRLGQSECWIQVLLVRNNNLSGELPSNLKNCYLLAVLDVGGNQLTGNIPPYLGADLPYLQVLSLRHNEFFGMIPPELCYPNNIQVLDLSVNNMSGRIPRCFNNYTSLVQSNLPNITTIDMFLVYPFNQHSADVLSALVYWRGKEEEYNKTLRFLKLIDLSNNRFVGNIPKEFSLLKGLISLNLSRNHLTGNIDSGIGQMQMLESLDLSRNQLSGEIPIGMAELSYLADLDLSNNNLSGSIPTGIQLQGFSASAYAGNNELCGPPLAACLASPGPGTTSQATGLVGKEDSKFDMVFYICVVLGFVVGFWGVIVVLALKRSWRIAYFGFWNKIYDWLYVTTTVYICNKTWMMKLLQTKEVATRSGAAAGEGGEEQQLAEVAGGVTGGDSRTALATGDGAGWGSKMHRRALLEYLDLSGNQLQASYIQALKSLSTVAVECSYFFSHASTCICVSPFVELPSTSQSFNSSINGTSSNSTGATSQPLELEDSAPNSIVPLIERPRPIFPIALMRAEVAFWLVIATSFTDFFETAAFLSKSPNCSLNSIMPLI